MQNLPFLKTAFLLYCTNYLIIIPFLSYDNCRTIYLFYCVFYIFDSFLFFFFHLFYRSNFHILFSSFFLSTPRHTHEHWKFFFRQKHMYDIIYLYTILCIYFYFSRFSHWCQRNKMYFVEKTPKVGL